MYCSVYAVKPIYDNLFHKNGFSTSKNLKGSPGNQFLKLLFFFKPILLFAELIYKIYGEQTQIFKN